MEAFDQKLALVFPGQGISSSGWGRALQAFPGHAVF